MPERQRISSGGPWEDRIGYSRAVRVDDHVWVSGTTGTHPDGTIPDGTYAQTRLALATIEAALREAGATSDEAVGVLLNEHFGRAKPVMTMNQVTRSIRSTAPRSRRSSAARGRTYALRMIE